MFGGHDPDTSFKHLKAQFPGVVIELSYSQKRLEQDEERAVKRLQCEDPSYRSWLNTV